MTDRPKDIGRLVVDLLMDVEVKQVTKRRVESLFGRRAMAGINFDTSQIYLQKNLSHADKVRSLLHELAHYYVFKYEGIEVNDHDEDKIEALAAQWQKTLYGRKGVE